MSVLGQLIYSNYIYAISRRLVVGLMYSKSTTNRFFCGFAVRLYDLLFDCSTFVVRLKDLL